MQDGFLYHNLCVIGFLLTNRNIHFESMSQMLVLLWRPAKRGGYSGGS